MSLLPVVLIVSALLPATPTYDALGRRIRTEDSGLRTKHFYYDQNNIIAEYDANDTLQRSYVNGSHYVDERVAVGVSADRFSFYLLGQQYTPVGLIDDNGELQELYEYEPYGEVKIYEPGEGEPIPPDCDNPSGWHRVLSSSRNPFFFQGRRMESLAVPLGETHPTRQLYDYDHRFMSPLLSRWLQRDPLGPVDGMNPYEFERSNPFKYTDPTGKAVIPHIFQLNQQQIAQQSYEDLIDTLYNLDWQIDPIFYGSQPNYNLNPEFLQELRRRVVIGITDKWGQVAPDDAQLGAMILHMEGRSPQEIWQEGDYLPTVASHNFYHRMLNERQQINSTRVNRHLEEWIRQYANFTLGTASGPMFRAAGAILGGGVMEASAATEAIERTDDVLSLIPDSVKDQIAQPEDLLPRNVYSGVRDASEYLRNARISRGRRLEWLQSFQSETVSIHPAGPNEFGIRFYDNINSFPNGRFLFETFPASRQSLAIHPRWNQMTFFKQWQIRPNAWVIEGKAASQGLGLEGGQLQKLILNPDQDLLP